MANWGNVFFGSFWGIVGVFIIINPIFFSQKLTKIFYWWFSRFTLRDKNKKDFFFTKKLFLFRVLGMFITLFGLLSVIANLKLILN